MDEFGVLTERFGLKPDGKSAPMAAWRRPATTNHATSSASNRDLTKTRAVSEASTILMTSSAAKQLCRVSLPIPRRHRTRPGFSSLRSSPAEPSQIQPSPQPLFPLATLRSGTFSSTVPLLTFTGPSLHRITGVIGGELQVREQNRGNRSGEEGERKK
ncbi:hypothetical protein M0R45_012877 [Rubus argutus]|uniref:Uncharacterized protein n=1 Tax=Rubus argutus TaxID=59490 RepID=A0AAW1XHY7_RUBAR